MDQGWIDGQLPWRRTGAIEVLKERPWSLVAKVPTERGLVWFKENRAGSRYEAALLPMLAQWHPDRVLTPIASEPSRGWTLLPHGGTIQREADRPADSAQWARLLAEHGQLQRDLADRVPELLAAGVPDVRPANLMTYLPGLPVPDSVQPYLPTLAGLCEDLAASPIPASLQHDDLHDGNVFSDGRVFDWGDSTVSHPFGVLLISLRMAGTRLEVPPGDPVLIRLRDAYLEPWTDLADRATLLANAEVAIHITKVSRALAWQRSLLDATPDQLSEYAYAIPYWLESLLE